MTGAAAGGGGEVGGKVDGGLGAVVTGAIDTIAGGDAAATDPTHWSASRLLMRPASLVSIESPHRVLIETQSVM